MKEVLFTGVLALAAFAASGPAQEDFDQRLEGYVKLRGQAVKNVPPLGKKSTPAEIQQHEQALAQAIRAARSDAKPGDLLTPGMKPVFAAILRTKMSGRKGKSVRAAVKEGNPRNEKAPGEVEPVLQVNAVYPKNAPLSTVPPSLLLRLPKLPKDIEYRFIGRTLILRDRQANIIIDFMKEAAPAL